MSGTSKNTVRWLWRVTGRKKGYILALTLIQGAGGVTGVLYALLLRAIVDSAVAGDAVSFRRSVLLIIGLVLVQLSISALIRWLVELAKSDIENGFKQRLVDNLLQKDYASVAATHTAEWLNRLTNDTTVVAGGAVEILPGLAGMVVRLFSALIMIIALDRWFACIFVPGGILLIFLSYAFRRVLKRLHKDIQETDGMLRIFLQERISSLMVIKAFTAEAQISRGAAEAMAGHKKARLRRNRFSNVANIGFGAAMQGMYLIGVVYCAHGILTGTVTYGTLTAIMQLIGQVQGPFVNISGYLPRWYALCASAERMMEVEEYTDDTPPLSLEVIKKSCREMISFGLTDASFSYHAENRRNGRSDVKGSFAKEPFTVSPVPVFDHLQLEIRKGEYVAFTGHSGCGKSTVLKLLMCMYPLDGGERFLRIGDKTEPLTAAWRRLFAYVPQGNVLMNGTIREMVSFAAPEADRDDARLKRALSIACAYAFVDDLDVLLGERGTGLSEGQMQRIAIARAIFADSPVLLLDEATSALDEKTEKRLLENLRELTDKTVIIVTHRKAALSICDRVLEFTQKGVIPRV